MSPRSFLAQAILIAAGSVASLQSYSQNPAQTSSRVEAESEGQKPNSNRSTLAAKVMDEASDSPRIQNLVINSDPMPVTMIKRGRDLQPFVQLKGSFKRAGWTLSHQSGSETRSLALGADSSFSVFVILKAELNYVFLSATGPDGRSEKQIVRIYSPDARPYKVGLNLGQFSLHAGGGAFSYFQTGFGNFESKNVVQELSYLSPIFFSRWAGALNFKSPIWTVSSAPIDASPDLLQANADIHYRAIDSNFLPYRLFFRAGMSYVTLLTYGAPFGFKNLFVPSVSSIFKYRTGAHTEIEFMARYFPLEGLLALTSGFDLEVSYNMKLANLHELKLKGGIARLSYKPEATADIRARLMILSVGYTF
jgi:hypothetical protein